MNRGLNISQPFSTLGRLLYIHGYNTYICLYIHICCSTVLFVQSGVFLALPLRLVLCSRCCHSAVMLRQRHRHSHAVRALFCSEGLADRALHSAAAIWYFPRLFSVPPLNAAIRVVTGGEGMWDVPVSTASASPTAHAPLQRRLQRTEGQTWAGF